MKNKYYLGLDMGVGSVGWAVTDENYQLLRARGKDLWGVRLFDEASTAADRRSNRVSRRRRQRERARIRFLKNIFKTSIDQVDPGFFERLDDSKFFVEDKHEHQPFALFADTGYTDEEYFQDYPTIFHLRMELIKNPEPHDVRLVYLAILNLFKYRGHFLASNIDGEHQTNFKEIYHQFKIKAEALFVMDLPDERKAQEIEDILSSDRMSRTAKTTALTKIFGIKGEFVEIIKLCCGRKGNLNKVFPELQSEDKKSISLSFKDSELETELADLRASGLDEDGFDFLLTVKQIYDQSLLDQVMKDAKGQTYYYLSEARIAAYEKHHKDLKILKHLYKTYAPKNYYGMFRTMEKDNYSAYVGSVQYKDKSIRRGAACTRDEFYKKIKKAVSAMPETDERAYVLSEIETETFLPKQHTADNGVIPNQVHARELKAILKNAEDYLPFLKEKDDTGLTNSEKIIQMFSFQIPYYVGPLNSEHSQNAWAVRKERGTVYPWNFEKKIDVKASSEKFIERLVRHCTYLHYQRVLPKNSLLYEKFRVLNELNSLRINGERIDVSLKQAIYNDLFKKGKKVTQKKIKRYLIANGMIAKNEPIVLSGIDGDFTNTLANRKKFLDLFDTNTLTIKQEKIAENIINWSTVYGDSRKFLKERIEEAYGNVLSEGQIKRVLGLKFSDWGRLSKVFLNLEGMNRETGEIKTIIQALWEGDGERNFNLMELLSDGFTYLDEIEKRSSKIEKDIFEIDYSDLEGLYLSAPVRRMVWQTILIIKELREVLGVPPERIFVEMARDAENHRGQRKDSRKANLLKAYQNIKGEQRDWVSEIKSRDDSEFRIKKLFLYYTQMGRCMYTGTPIDLKDLFDDNLYDLDHIYPRHFVKDDSLINNLVLVKKEKNSNKQDRFPIERTIQNKQRAYWKMLLDRDLITREKFNRLIRTTPFSNEELANFISRQMVETRQATKTVAQVLKNTMPNSEIVYVKAGNVSSFRQQFDLPKCRILNDLHHANDAYLNIVVGNVYLTKFTKNPMIFIKKYRDNPNTHQYNMGKMFECTVKRGNSVAWDMENNTSIRMIRKMMRKNSPIITRRSFEKHGKFTDTTIYGHKAAQKRTSDYLPVKSISEPRLVNIDRYGGLTSLSVSHFSLVEYTKRKKKVRELVPIYIYIKDKLNDKTSVEKYCKDQLHMQDTSVRLLKIKTGSYIKVNGYPFYLTGRTTRYMLTKNAAQLYLSGEEQRYLNCLIKAKDKTLSQKEKEKNHVDNEHNLNFYDMLIRKAETSVFKFKLHDAFSNEKVSPLFIWKNKRNIFTTLPFDKQAVVLNNMIQYFNENAGGNWMQELGIKGSKGKLYLKLKISEYDSCRLINQSATGLFEKEVDLLTI